MRGERRVPAAHPRRGDDDATAASAVRLAGTIAARCGGYTHLVHVRAYGSQTRHHLAVLSTELAGLTGDEPGFDVLRGCMAPRRSATSRAVAVRRWASWGVVA